MEVIRIVVRLSGPQTPAGIAHLGVFDLDDLGAHPGESLRARRTGLELGEIDDLHALQKVEVRKIGRHERSLDEVVTLPRGPAPPAAATAHDARCRRAARARA